MSDIEPTSPIARPPRLPEVTAFVDGGQVVGSGSLLIEKSQKILLQYGSVKIELSFEFDGGEHGVKGKVLNDGEKLNITLLNFDNPLGTAYGPAVVGNTFGRELKISIYVETLQPKLQNVSYSLYLGDDVGEQ